MRRKTHRRQRKKITNSLLQENHRDYAALLYCEVPCTASRPISNAERTRSAQIDKDRFFAKSRDRAPELALSREPDRRDFRAAASHQPLSLGRAEIGVVHGYVHTIRSECEHPSSTKDYDAFERLLKC